jgi:hypothetical protein
LRELRTLDGDRNARFMPKQEWEQLVANLRLDGELTSTPLVALGGIAPLTDGGVEQLEVLSGNHRVLAAIEAGIEDADVLELVTPVGIERKRAIQLAHNKIAGRDDPNTLQQLYESLGIESRIYTGLSDEDFKLPDVDLASLSIGGLKFQEVVLAFLPPEKEALDQLLERTRAGTQAQIHLARIEDFDPFLDLISRIKSKRRVVNSAVALGIAIELAAQRLDQIEADEAAMAAAVMAGEGDDGSQAEVHH